MIVCVCVCVCRLVTKNKIFFFSVFAIFSRLLLSLNPCAASRPAKRKNLFVKQTKLNLTWSPDRSFFTIHHNQFCIVFAFRVCCRTFPSLNSFFFLLLVIPHRNLCQPPTFKHTGKWKRKKKSKQNINKPNCRGFPSKYNLTCFFLTPKSHIHSFFYAER